MLTRYQLLKNEVLKLESRILLQDLANPLNKYMKINKVMFYEVVG